MNERHGTCPNCGAAFLLEASQALHSSIDCGKCGRSYTISDLWKEHQAQGRTQDTPAAVELQERTPMRDHYGICPSCNVKQAFWHEWPGMVIACRNCGKQHSAADFEITKQQQEPWQPYGWRVERNALDQVEAVHLCGEKRQDTLRLTGQSAYHAQSIIAGRVKEGITPERLGRELWSRFQWIVAQEPGEYSWSWEDIGPALKSDKGRVYRLNSEQWKRAQRLIERYHTQGAMPREEMARLLWEVFVGDATVGA